MSGISIDELAAADLADHLDDFARLLHATVHAGASVGFILPYPLAEARAFWNDQVYPVVAGGGRILLVARVGGVLAGTVQLQLAMFPNQRHRGEVSKLLVHPDFRRRGIARALMTRLEARARESGRRLLTLDTRTGDSAEPLYASLGYSVAGVIPGYCRAPGEERLDATTYMYKAI